MDDDAVYELDPNYGRSNSKHNNGDDIHLDDFQDNDDDNNNNDNNYDDNNDDVNNNNDNNYDDNNDDNDKGNNPNNNSFITVDNNNDDNDDNNDNNNNNSNDDRGFRFKATDGTLHYLDATSYRLMKKVTIDAIVKAAEAITITKQNDRPNLYKYTQSSRNNNSPSSINNNSASPKPKPKYTNVTTTTTTSKANTINFEKMKIEKGLQQLQIGIWRTGIIRISCVLYHSHKEATKHRFNQWASITRELSRTLRTYFSQWRDKTMRTILNRLTASRFLDLIPTPIVFHWSKRMKHFAFNKWLRWLNYSGAMHTVKLLFNCWKLNAKESKDIADNSVSIIKRRYISTLLGSTIMDWKRTINMKKRLKSLLSDERILMRRAMNKLVHVWSTWKSINVSAASSSIHDDSGNTSAFVNDSSVSDNSSSGTPFSRISSSPYSTPASKAHHVSCTCVSCVKAKALAKSNSKRTPNSPASRGPTSRQSRYGSDTKTTPSIKNITPSSNSNSSSGKKSSPNPTPKSRANVSVTFEDDENINCNNDDDNNNSASNVLNQNDSDIVATVNSTPSEKFRYRLQLANQLQERYGKK